SGALLVPGYFFFSKSSAAELMQYRSPVGLGPSSKTCPRWAPQRAQTTSSRSMKKVLSFSLPMFSFAIGEVKLGQPVPDSNLVSDEKRSFPQHTHLYVPFSWLFQNAPVKARSVPFLRVTMYCSSVRLFFHSSSVFWTL